MKVSSDALGKYTTKNNWSQFEKKTSFIFFFIFELCSLEFLILFGGGGPEDSDFELTYFFR